MMTPTHIAFSVALTSIALGTANPEILGIAAIASLLPDIDTSRSFIGRLFFPLSRWLETRTIHRGVTHSFFASGVITLISYPLAVYGYSHVWHGLILGYFFGWFADTFTKSGVQAFYPSRGRMIIPRNPRLRLGTRSNAEWFLLMVLIVIAILSININTAGGMIRGFNQAIGLPSGAIETAQEDASRYLLVAHVRGRNAITELPIDETYEVVEPLTANDLLVKDKQGTVYRVGSSQECQIIVTQMRIERVQPITIEVKDLTLDEDDLYSVLAQLPQERTYLSGTLTIHDAEDLMLPSHIDRFDTITLQPGELAYARLVSANPSSAIATLGDYSVSGNLIVRTIHVH
jgi:inner membrane protein